MRKIVLIAHNLRSAHNVGSLLRTADGLGVNEVYLTGYTPYPETDNDSRLPHIASKLTRQINKTALGAEKSVEWYHSNNCLELLKKLRKEGFLIASLEQSPDSVSLAGYKPPQKIAVIVGREVEGIETKVLEASDVIIEIPMLGNKESFNVAQSAAIALYHLRYCK